MLVTNYHSQEDTITIKLRKEKKLKLNFKLNANFSNIHDEAIPA